MSNLNAAISMAKEVQALVTLIQRIKDALGTEENGEALVEVARNAHRAEMELVIIYKIAQENEHSQILSQLIMEAIDNG